MKKIISYSLYPALFAITLAIITLAINNQWNYSRVYSGTTVFILLTLIIVERIFPLEKKWSMTKESFVRDFKYIIFVAPTIVITKTVIATLFFEYSKKNVGPLTGTSTLVGAITFLLIFEFFQYWYHRLSHTMQGRTGKLLWNIHVTHHLPDKVYVIMHAVFNPLNAVVATTIIQVPLLLLGVSPAAILAATLLIDLQSLISHFNFDLRGGVFNYIFIGTETHRYHHSADQSESGNYGNTLAIWDQVFGTFVYRPGINPKELGVTEPRLYPDSNNVIAVLALPFKNLIKR